MKNIIIALICLFGLTLSGCGAGSTLGVMLDPTNPKHYETIPIKDFAKCQLIDQNGKGGFIYYKTVDPEYKCLIRVQQVSDTDNHPELFICLMKTHGYWTPVRFENIGLPIETAVDRQYRTEQEAYQAVLPLIYK